MAPEEESSEPHQVPPVPHEAAEVFGDSLDLVVRFAALLAQEGEKRGLIGPRELPILWDRHLINSAAVSQFIDDGERVADVGSGAGFPGLVLGIMRPNVEIHLIETMERRCVWLRDVIDALELRNVTVHRGRAEDLSFDFGFDVVTARAVAAVSKLAHWTVPLLAAHGRLVLLKGRRAAEELEAARKVLRKLGIRKNSIEEVSMPGSSDSTFIVICEK